MAPSSRFITHTSIYRAFLGTLTSRGCSFIPKHKWKTNACWGTDEACGFFPTERKFDHQQLAGLSQALPNGERCISVYPVFLPAHEVPSSPHLFLAEGGWRHLSPSPWASRIARCPNSSLSTMSPVTQHTSPNLWSPSCGDSQLSDFSLSQGQATGSFLSLLRGADLGTHWDSSTQGQVCHLLEPFFFILGLLSKTYFYVWMFVSLGHFNR